MNTIVNVSVMNVCVWITISIYKRYSINININTFSWSQPYIGLINVIWRHRNHNHTI